METVKKDFEIIPLRWENAYFDWKTKNYNVFPNASGIYQIYGTSPLYGLDTLLYIGQAKDLRYRIKQHFESSESFIGRQPNKSCRYALLDPSSLTIVEQTLIAMHKPSFNSANLINLHNDSKSRFIYIQNLGERGILNIEVTNYFFLLNPNIFNDDKVNTL